MQAIGLKGRIEGLKTMKEPFQLDELLSKAADGGALSGSEMEFALDQLTQGARSEDDMGEFLLALKERGETVEEVTAAARLLRSRMSPVSCPDGTIDIVGTGGDGHHTYNVSTCAAFVAAGAGARVAKHGNRSVSSLSGASDVLSSLGVKLDVSADTISKAIEQAGAGFMWAPMHHPSMKAWAPVRAKLGVRTMFNVLGPICNPAGVKRQVVGVFDKRWMEPLAHVLGNLGSTHVWVGHGHDGMDELTTTGPTSVAELHDGRVTVFDVVPEDAGLSRATLEQLKGGDASVNAAALRRVLDGEQSAYRDIVALNAGAGLVVAGLASNLSDGVRAANAAIDNGKGLAALTKLVEITNSA